MTNQTQQKHSRYQTNAMIHSTSENHQYHDGYRQRENILICLNRCKINHDKHDQTTNTSYENVLHHKAHHVQDTSCFL